MTRFGQPMFTHVGALTCPTGVLGLIDPCLIDKTNPYAQPENYAARIAIGFDQWDAHIRFDGHENVAELRLTPSGTPADRVRIDWDGIHPDLSNHDMAIRHVGEVGIDSGTVIALDPTTATATSLDYAAHISDMIDDNNSAWTIPATDMPAGAVVSSTGCGDGAYDIHLITTTNTHPLGEGHPTVVIINFGLDDEIHRCSDCGEEEGHCRCEACTGCGSYYIADDLRDGQCEDCLHVDEDDLA